MMKQPPVGSETRPTRTLYQMTSESPELRWSFIRKIYSIFAMQLLLIVALGAIVVSYHHIVAFLTTTGGALACYLLLFITPFITLCSLYCHHQRHAFNYVLLGIFTVSLASAVSVSCAFPSGGPIDLYHVGDRDQCKYPDIKENQESFEGTNPNTRYILKKRYDRGAFGEVWMAFHRNHLQQSNTTTANDNFFIVKRIMVERGNTVYLSGLREKYFGELFLDASSHLGGTSTVKHSYPYPYPHYYSLLIENESVAPEYIPSRQFAYEEGLKHIARYIESFGSKSNEIWLVFRHEGTSLSKLLYTTDDIGTVDGTENENDDHLKDVRLLHPSNWWRWLKTTKTGQTEMRSLIRQLLIALKSCHDRNITHRDIKPDNMIVCFEDNKSGRCLDRTRTGDATYITKMRIIDFGSAMDEFTIKHLYGAAGPSRDEQTTDYMPPEAFLNATWYHGPSRITTKYDMWSVGVVILELIIGSPNVFQLDARTHALLDQHLEGWNEELKALAYKLKSYMDLCILLPGSSTKLLTRGQNGKGSGLPPATWKCSEEFFSTQFKSRDPFKIGFPNVWALRLVRQLLVWDAEDRLTVEDALKHPYFTHYTTSDTHDDQQVHVF